MDYGFMRASTLQLGQPNKTHNRVVLSHDGYTSYLLIINKASRHAWVFLIKLKSPPLDFIDAFLTHFGHGMVQANVGQKVMLITLSEGYFSTNFYIR
jgi:hypothetical protein